jgi:glycosyltransferase involved in cell wall biosynthesis
MPMTNPALISVITPSFTTARLKDVAELLDSVQAQTYHNIEVIVVTERPAELADVIRKYVEEKNYSRVRVLCNEQEPGSYAARNLGVQQAQGDILAFIDDDALLLPDWAEETVKAYAEDDSIIGLTGPILPQWAEDSMSWFPRELYWIFSCTYWDWNEETQVRNGYGTNISFRREAFDRCGLFINSLEAKEHRGSDWQRPGAKETEFSLRVTRTTGKRIMYHPRIGVKHKVYHYRLSTGFIIRRAYWEGYATALLNRWYHSSQREVLSTEYGLLRRILFRALPQSLGLLFRRPATGLRRLWVFGLTLGSVATGYASYMLGSLPRARSRATG